MLSIRAFARSVPRTISRFPTSAARQPSRLVPKSSFLQTSCLKTSRPSLAAAFSTSRSRSQEKQGEVDQELAAKLGSELQMENEMRDAEDLPPSVKDYLDNGPFELTDVAGEEEVTLTRKFGDEEIKIVFSIDSLDALQDPDRYDDRALSDEQEFDDGEEESNGNINQASAQSGGARSKGSKVEGRTQDGNINVAAEDSVAPADRTELADDESPDEEEPVEPSFPARLLITITKPSSPKTGALQIDATAQDGLVILEGVSYLPASRAARITSPSAETEFSQRAAYMGPPFGNLDEDLQVLLERYLDERGVNTALALFVPDYIDHKEQREYLQWLGGVKGFVES